MNNNVTSTIDNGRKLFWKDGRLVLSTLNTALTVEEVELTLFGTVTSAPKSSSTAVAEAPTGTPDFGDPTSKYARYGDKLRPSGTLITADVVEPLAGDKVQLPETIENPFLVDTYKGGVATINEVKKHKGEYFFTTEEYPTLVFAWPLASASSDEDSSPDYDDEDDNDEDNW